MLMFAKRESRKAKINRLRERVSHWAGVRDLRARRVVNRDMSEQEHSCLRKQLIEAREQLEVARDALALELV